MSTSTSPDTNQPVSENAPTASPGPADGATTAQNTPAKSSRLQAIRPWLHKGGFAILDRALFAGTNFLVNVLLIRWMPGDAAGAFVVAYSLFLLIANYHTALIIEPMLVFGAGKFNKFLKRYFWMVLVVHSGISVFSVLALAAIALVLNRLGQDLLAQAMLGSAIAVPTTLLLWISRRSFYIKAKPQWSAAGGFIYMVMQIIGITVLYLIKVDTTIAWDTALTTGSLPGIIVTTHTLLTPFTAMIMLGITGLVVGVWLAYQFHPQRHAGDTPLTYRDLIRDHMNYGKWAGGARLLEWIPSNIYYTLLPAFVGLAGSAAMRAVMNLILPILNMNVAISTLVLPTFVRRYNKGGVAGLNRFVMKTLMLFVVTSGGYIILMLLFGYTAMDLLYDGKFNEFVTPLVLFLVGLMPFLGGLNAVFGGALRAVEKVDNIFWVYVFTSVITLTIGLAVLSMGGVIGGIMGLTISGATTSLGIAFFYLRYTRREMEKPKPVVEQAI